MLITEVKIFLKADAEPDGSKLKAYASITFDNSFMVRGLKVIDGKDGLFVVMPGVKLLDGRFRDIAHPTNIFMRKVIEFKVLEEFMCTKQSAFAAAQ